MNLSCSLMVRTCVEYNGVGVSDELGMNNFIWPEVFPFYLYVDWGKGDKKKNDKKHISVLV